MGQTLALLHSVEGLVFVAAASVRPHHPLVIPGDYLLNLLVPVPGPHLVDRSLICIECIEGHQVGRLPTYLPASIVGVDYNSWYTWPTRPLAQRILGNGSLG